MEDVLVALKEAIQLVADIPVEDIDDDSHMIDELGLASTEIMSVIAELESQFSVAVDDNELISIGTVRELAELVRSKYEK